MKYLFLCLNFLYLYCNIHTYQIYICYIYICYICIYQIYICYIYIYHIYICYICIYHIYICYICIYHIYICYICIYHIYIWYVYDYHILIKIKFRWSWSWRINFLTYYFFLLHRNSCRKSTKLPEELKCATAIEQEIYKVVFYDFFLKNHFFLSVFFR